MKNRMKLRRSIERRRELMEKARVGFEKRNKKDVMIPVLWPEQSASNDDGAKERAYCALEAAAIRLHRGQPLFFPFAEMSEHNKTFRRELIMGLLLALDLLRQNGVSVEQTAQVEKIRRAYTSA